jgi:hypothetical protein
VAGAVFIPVAVQNKIVTGLLSASFCECPRADPHRKVAPVNIAANHASICLRASSIALQFFEVFPRLFGSLSGSIESKQFAEWWNVINDEKREWTDSPNSQKS